MNAFLTSNSTGMRLARTILQGIIGVIIANADVIAGHYVLDAPSRALVVALVMAVLSPIMAELGKHTEADDA